MQAHAARRGVQHRHEGDDDVQQGLGGRLHAELGLRADHGGTDVEEAAGAVAGQPAGPVYGHQGHQKLLELGGREGRQADAHGRHQHALGVAVGPEQAQLAVVAPVRLHALEALGGVVKDRGGGHQ